MRRISVLPFLSLAACSVFVPGVFAQDEGVVVSATRVPQPSLEIPASVDRIYADEIREGRPQVNLSESLGRVPGISVQNRGNYAQDLQIQSRGFGARSTFGVRGIKLYADGIPGSMPDGQGQAASFDLGSAQSVEVLRGPFSSMYGSSAGGVILVQTEDGPETPTADASVLFGSYGTRRGALKFGGQWGSLNAIGDASRFETDGYRNHSAAQRDQLNAKLRYAAGSDTSVTLIANSLRQPQTQDPGGLTKSQVEQDPRQVQPQALTLNTRKTVFHEQAGLVLDHRLDAGATLQAVGYYGQRWQEQYLAIVPNGVVNIDRGFGGGALRYSNPLSTALRISIGAEHDRMHDRRKGFNNASGFQGALTRDEDNDAWSTGLYAQGEWKFAERWSAHAGVRRSTVRFRNSDHFLTNGDDSGDRAYSATTPVAGIVFRANPSTSLYANVGKGFETPTFLELANRSGGASGLNFALNASSSRHAEVGLKTVARSVRLNAAVFDIVTSDEIVVDTNVGGRASFKNVGHTDRRGLELAAETVGSGPFEARVAYTYLKAVYRESFSTQILTAGPQVTVPAGSQIAGVPRSTLYAEVRYRREPFFAQLEGLGKSRVAVNDPNLEFAAGYAVLNAAAGLVQQDNRWRFTEFARVDNLTGKNYVGSVIVNEGNGRYYEPSPRRNMTIGVQASLRF
jgi:iron complex outermembrane receptor protein